MKTTTKTTISLHPGQKHLDDCAVSALCRFLNEIRESQDGTWPHFHVVRGAADNAILVDWGGEYNPEAGIIDHHFPGGANSCFPLFWKYVREMWSDIAKLHLDLTDLCSLCDFADTGHKGNEQLAYVTRTFSFLENTDTNCADGAMVGFLYQLIRAQWLKIEAKREEELIFANRMVYSNWLTGKTIIDVLDKPCFNWRDFPDHAEYSLANTPRGWNLIHESGEIPIETPRAKFRHPSNFLASYDCYLDALNDVEDSMGYGGLEEK